MVVDQPVRSWEVMEQGPEAFRKVLLFGTEGI